MLAGWSADLSTATGTGVTGLHVWAYPLTGGAPIFAGPATYGGARPDVADVHGEQFRNSGFGLTVYGLPPANYDVAVFRVEHRALGISRRPMLSVTVR